MSIRAQRTRKRVHAVGCLPAAQQHLDTAETPEELKIREGLSGVMQHDQPQSGGCLRFSRVVRTENPEKSRIREGVHLTRGTNE